MRQKKTKRERETQMRQKKNAGRETHRLDRERNETEED